MRTCINCGLELKLTNGIELCVHCNTEAADLLNGVQAEQQFDTDDHVFIECPGATLYEQGTTIVQQGAKFLDENNPSRGFVVVGSPVYSPTHTKKRRIKREALGKIRRCQGCQDMTVRMRRPEGPDFCIPSSKFPNRKKLRSVTPSSQS